VKSTLDKGVKQTLKPCACDQSEPFGVTVCLLHNEPTSRASAARLSPSGAEPKRKRASTGRGVAGGGRETLRSTHGQDEGVVKRTGGPNQ
jgi:hypothetical protein